MRNNQRRTGQKPSPQPSSPAPMADMAFAVPTEFVKLPSRGKFYPEEHPLYNQETVEIKFMTAKDEDILSSQALLEANLAVDRLLESLLVQDIDPGTLLVGDRSAILIAARISGYGENYDVDHRCPKCLTSLEVNFRLSGVTLNDKCFEEDFMHENGIVYNEDTQTFDLTLPASGVQVGLRLIDGYAEKEALSYENDNKRESLVTSTLAAFLVKVNDDTNPKYVESFIEAMPAKDSKYIRDLYPQMVPTVRLLHDFQCKACYHKGELEVPLRAAFFWP